MRIGLLSDLHIGDSGEGRWHNRQLLDNAEQIARSAVDTLNHHNLDLVVVTGDLTNSGTRDQFLSVKAVLSSLKSAWYVVPGNHDRPGIVDGTFKSVFQSHYPDTYMVIGGVGMLFLTEKLPTESAVPALGVAQGAYDAQISDIAHNQHQLLLVFSHFQLESEESHAVRHNTGYVDHYLDGHDFRKRLERAVPGKVAGFFGHQHWHHISVDGRYVQCTTGAAVEFPMECRVVTIDGESLTVETLDTTVPELAARSLVAEPWAQGTEPDRSLTVELS